MTANTSRRIARRWRRAGWTGLVVLWLVTPPVQAETFTEDFSGPKPSWKPDVKESSLRVMAQRRSSAGGKDGYGESIQIEAAQPDQKLRLIHKLPQAPVIDDLEVAVWVRTTTPGLRLFLRVVLPQYADPVENRPLAFLIPGDTTEEADGWQLLTCRAAEKLVNERIGWLRAKRFLPQEEPKIKLVDSVIVQGTLPRGVHEISFDDLTLGPLASLEEEEIKLLEWETETNDEQPIARINLDHLEVAGEPFFLRMVEHHGEPLAELARARFNTVKIQDYRDQALLNSLEREGLWGTAAPHPPHNEGGDVLSAPEAGLLPFSDQTRVIAFWMLGYRITPQVQPGVLNWMEQIREADRKYRRPIAADVTADERTYSREIDLLGVSRHTIGGSISPQAYRDRLKDRQLRARPGSFCWTWIQAMPSPAVSRLNQLYHAPDLLEPEQIRMQAYIALASGMRGLGFWTTRPLGEETPADRETFLAVQQLNQEFWLLEPLLATANTVEQIPATIETPPQDAMLRLRASKEAGKSPLLQRDSRARDQEARQQELRSQEQEISAAVLRTDRGTLILPMWLGNQAQYVPGRMAAHAISLIVPIDETATAWEITTTGIHYVERKRVSGGVKLILHEFDQTACILLTSDKELVEEMKHRAAAIQEESARSYLAAAELKLERVRAIDQQLGDLGLREFAGPQLLGDGRVAIQEAHEGVSRQQWAAVRKKSREAMQAARILARAHWEQAVADLPSPVASPLAVSFQTLPAQAQLAARLLSKSAVESENLLPSGHFEDSHTLEVVGWQHTQDVPEESVFGGADLVPEGYRSRTCLQLSAKRQGRGPAADFCGCDGVTVITPPVTVHAGQAVRVSGWIRIPAALKETADGVMIYDNLQGRSLALRFSDACRWQRFEFVRLATQSQAATVTLALTGLGEVFVDDLQITTIDLGPVSQTSATGSRPQPAAPQRRWSDIRRWNPLTPR